MSQPTPCLAVILAAPQDGEAAMHSDMTAMNCALHDRGLSADRIYSLHGQLNRPLVLAILQAVPSPHEWMARGYTLCPCQRSRLFSGATAQTARPGLLFRQTDDVENQYHLFWDEFFAALCLPPGVQFILLPDL